MAKIRNRTWFSNKSVELLELEEKLKALKEEVLQAVVPYVKSEQLHTIRIYREDQEMLEILEDGGEIDIYSPEEEYSYAPEDLTLEEISCIIEQIRWD